MSATIESEDQVSPDAGCTLREFEYDGSRYCGTHFGFALRGGDPWCDLSPRAKAPTMPEQQTNPATDDSEDARFRSLLAQSSVSPTEEDLADGAYPSEEHARSLIALAYQIAAETDDGPDTTAT